MNSRLAGNYFEYCVYSCINADPFDEYTKNKFTSFDYLNKDNPFFNLDPIIKKRDIRYVQLLKDSQGKEGVTSDLVLHTSNGKQIGISCKKNNLSIKHPCPKGILRFLSPPDDTTFIKDYEALNRKWYNKIVKYELFRNVPPATKQRMLQQFTGYITPYINTQYVKFLLSYSPHKENYLIHFNDSKQHKDRIRIYKMKNVCFNGLSVEQHKHWIHVKLPRGITIRMRLHTASSRINKNLKLKFDTKIDKIDRLFSCL